GDPPPGGRRAGVPGRRTRRESERSGERRCRRWHRRRSDRRGRRHRPRGHRGCPAGPGRTGDTPMTNPEIPDGVATETVYAVEISYSPEAKERRPPVRHEHLTRVARLLREGKLVEAGGFLDFKSALLIFRVGGGQAAIEHL